MGVKPFESYDRFAGQKGLIGGYSPWEHLSGSAQFGNYPIVIECNGGKNGLPAVWDIIVCIKRSNGWNFLGKREHKMNISSFYVYYIDIIVEIIGNVSFRECLGFIAFFYIIYEYIMVKQCFPLIYFLLPEPSIKIHTHSLKSEVWG